MTLCLRCGDHPIATEEPPSFPFCKACWPEVARRANYFVDEMENFSGFLSQDEVAEGLLQAGEAALAMAEEEGLLDERPGTVFLLRADPHRWGAGLIHLIDPDRDQTMCGKSPGGCPGTKFSGTNDQITCKSCLRSIEAKARNEQLRREWEDREREREERQRHWWRYYDAYLLTRRYPQDCWPGSPEWIAQEKLFDLIAICEGCHDDVHGFAP